MRTLWVLNAVGTKKDQIRQEMMGSRDRDWESWSKMLVLTCEVMSLWQVVPRKEGHFDVVHVDESVAEKEKRDVHTTG